MIATAAIPLNLATAVAATAPLREHTTFLRSVGDAGTARFAKQLAEVVARPRRDFARMTASVAGVPPVARGLNAHVAPQRDVLRMVNEALNVTVQVAGSQGWRSPSAVRTSTVERPFLAAVLR
jgi:hypothetical protein